MYQDTYHMLNESQLNRNRGDSIVPTRKRQDETNDVQIEIEKREGREKQNKVNQHQERKKEDNTQGEYSYFRLARSAGGGVAPRRNNRITESATKERREAKRKSSKATQETNGKRQHERTKRTNLYTLVD